MGNIWYLNVVSVMHGIALLKLSPEKHFATAEQVTHVGRVNEQHPHI